jgi:hypothetical protein
MIGPWLNSRNGKTEVVVVRGRDSENMDKWSTEEEKFKQSKKGLQKDKQ